ncbi:GNAT family N-acetyltransferase [Methanosarcina sp.]|uniref:GNAT family N-acetyltransferase n=1 Tax=Methanosarcina sp. TaxID=2213 RepID=UPI003C70E730
MTIKVELLTDKNETKWEEFVSHPNSAGIWHTLKWKKIIEEEYGFKSHYLLAIDGSEICGVLPLFQIKSLITGNRIVSLPFSYNCGPVANSDNSLTLLTSEAKKLAENLKCEYLELKMGASLPDESIKQSQLIESKFYYTSVLNLTEDPEVIWFNMDARRTKWAVRKAVRDDVTIRTETGYEDIKILHDLKVKTRQKHGSPAPSFQFFKRIMEEFGPEDVVKLWVAEYDNRIVSALMFYAFKDTVMPAYIASDDDYKSHMPNNLLYWKAIEWACKNGYKYFDFGRTEPDNETLLKFKSKWGCQNYKIPYYYYPKQPKLISQNRDSFKVSLVTNCWKKAPVPVLKILGPHLLKHVG